MIFHRCPVCHRVGIVHPGKPPGSGTNWTNRCIGLAVTGEPADGRYTLCDSWRGVKHSSDMCGFPMTDSDGVEIQDPFSAREYVDITRRKYNVGELKKTIMIRHQQTKQANQRA